MSERTGAHVAPLHALAIMGAAVVTFIAPFEPNATLRFGPVIAVAVFMLSNPLRFRIGLTEWAIYAFAAWVFAGQFWTNHPEAYEVNLLTVLSVLVIFIGLRSVTRDGVAVRSLIAAYVAGCFVGFVRTSSEFATPEAVRDSLNRVTAAGDLNVNYVAYSAVVGVLLLVIALRESAGRRRNRIAVYAIVVLLVAGIVATQTRGALLAVAFLFAWVVVSRVGTPLRTVTVAAIGAAVALSTGWGDGALHLLNFGERAVFGLSGRTELWEVARAAWSEHPLEGAGFGAVRAETAYSLPAHNTFLELGATLGAVGLTLFLLVVVSAMRDRTSAMSPPARRFRLGAIVVTLLPVLLSSTWELTASAWVALALLSQPVGSASRGDATTPASLTLDDRARTVSTV